MSTPTQHSLPEGELFITTADGRLPITFAFKAAGTGRQYEFTATGPWLSARHLVLFDPTAMLDLVAGQPAVKVADSEIRLTYTAITIGKTYAIDITLPEKVCMDAIIGRLAALEREVGRLAGLLAESKMPRDAPLVVTSIPFDHLLADDTAAHQFMLEHYMVRDYRTWRVAHMDERPGHLAESFLSSPEARLLFNLHWVSFVDSLDLVGIASPETSKDGLRFMTRAVDRREQMTMYRITSIAGLSRATCRPRGSFIFTLAGNEGGFSMQYENEDGGRTICVIVL